MTPELERSLSLAQVAIFQHKYAVFYSAIMCRLEYRFNHNTQTAQTDGTVVEINPEFWENLEPQARSAILLHEIKHVAHLHFLRADNRDIELWNIATDIRINNDILLESFSFGSFTEFLHDPRYDVPHLSEEEIYDDLLAREGRGESVRGNGSWGDNNVDLMEEGFGDRGSSELTDDQRNQIILVNQAIQQAQIMGGENTIPPQLRELVTSLNTPTVPWEIVLKEHLKELGEQDYSWSHRNKLYSDFYLPSLQEIEEGKLEHLMYFFDVSGSVTDEQILACTAELKHIQEELRPDLITLVQFDHRIQSIEQFTPDDPFKKMNVVGRGGTYLEPVKELIDEHAPSAVIIFSDLMCAPMSPLKHKTPVFWAVINNPEARVPFGKIVHIGDV